MARSRRRTACGMLFVLTAGACDATGPSVPRVIDVEVLPAEAPVARLRVTLDGTAPLELLYGTSEQPLLRVSSPAAEVHEVVLGRLLPDHSYVWSIEDAASGTIHAPPLPDDLAAIRFDATGSLSVPLVLLHLFQDGGFTGYVIVDERGRVVWWWRTEHFPFGIVRRESGTLVYMDRGAGLREITSAGDLLGEVAQDTAQRELHHDVIATPRNTLLFIAHDPRTIDGAKIRGEAIWEWTPETGGLVKRWSSWDHLDIETDRGPRFGTEWMHANALALGPAGTVLLSVHYFDQILALAPDFGSIAWRLGGPNATIAVEGTPFSGQHTPRFVGDDAVLLFDNGLGRGGPSRAVEYQIGGATAPVRWEWSAPNGNFAAAVSSARRLDNGNTLVAFGMSEGITGSTGPTEAYEVTRDGTVVWHLRVTGTVVLFRAEPWQTVAGEQ